MRLVRLSLMSALVFLLGIQAVARPKTDVQKLNELEQELELRAQLNQGAMYEQARKILPFRGETPDGRTFELVGVTPRGRLMIFATENDVAARTISTYPVLPGGITGLDLDGSGTTANRLAVWDAGPVLATHTEFGGRVTLANSFGEAHYHATHVAGTMIASGSVAAARGMSPAAELTSYDWSGDLSEMTNAAAQGLRISNHSYGYVRGWDYGAYNDEEDEGWYWLGDASISEEEDYMFGLYSSESRAYDEIAYAAPYYLICKSAGNDRGDAPPRGTEDYYYQRTVFGNTFWYHATGDPIFPKDGGSLGFDCVGDVASAKNILAVGAARDLTFGYEGPNSFRLTNLSSFSAFGPTDDGRVKPDIMGNGYELYSTYTGNNDSYAYLSGTSMSSPNVAGSINLLLRYYEETHQDSMLASTAKALVIHTADDDGVLAGPDYRFGWGLMNTRSAAELIATDTLDTMAIQELELADGAGNAWSFTSEGSGAAKITICWTDPAGTAGADLLDDRTEKIVNQLDLWMIGPNDTLYYPYSLDPEHPDVAARKDRHNTPDNVEQIAVDTLAPGNYTIYVTHRGTLTNGAQTYSMIASGIPSLGTTSAAEVGANSIPSNFEIVGAFPNPFNPTTTVKVNMPERGNLTVVAYNILGKQVATIHQGARNAGTHSFVFDGRDLASGVYFIQAISEDFGSLTKKVLLIR